MSTTTPRLQLKNWDGTDPFLRQDFIDNNNKLDAAPGSFICTSTTLPTWSVAQANRVAWLSDQRRFLEWSGTSWREPQTLTPGFATAITPNQYLSPNTWAEFTIGQWVVPRGGLFMSSVSLRIGCVPSSEQEINLYAGINGQYTSPSALGACRWPGPYGGGSPDNRMVTSIQSIGAAPGNPHTITARVYNSTGAPPVYIGAIMAQCWLVNYGMG